MSRHSRRGRYRVYYRDNDPRRAGYDLVRTPFGERAVPRGQGWREASKWWLFRMLGWAVLIVALWAIADIIIGALR